MMSSFSLIVLLAVICAATAASSTTARANFKTTTAATTKQSTTAATTKQTSTAATTKQTQPGNLYTKGTEFSLRFAAEQVKNVCNKKCVNQYDDMKDEEDNWIRYCDAFEAYADCLENNDPCAGSADKISDVQRRCKEGSPYTSSSSNVTAPEFSLRFAVEQVKNVCNKKCISQYEDMKDEEDNWIRYCNAFEDYADCLENDDPCTGSSDKISDVRRRCRASALSASSSSNVTAPELDIRVSVGALRGKCMGRCNNEFNILDDASDNKKEYCRAFIDYSDCLLHDSPCYKAKQSEVDWIIIHCGGDTVMTTQQPVASSASSTSTASSSNVKPPDLDLRIAVEALHEKCSKYCNNEFNIVDDASDNKKEYCRAFIDYSDCLLHDSPCYKVKQKDIDGIIRRCDFPTIQEPELEIILMVGILHRKCSDYCSIEYNIVNDTRDNKKEYCRASIDYSHCLLYISPCDEVRQGDVDWLMRHCRDRTVMTTQQPVTGKPTQPVTTKPTQLGLVDFNLKYAAHQVKSKCNVKCFGQWKSVMQAHDRATYCSKFDIYAACLQKNTCFGSAQGIERVQSLCRNNQLESFTSNGEAPEADIRLAVERIHSKCPMACTSVYDMMHDVRDNRRQYCSAFVRYSGCLKDDWLCFVKQTAFDYVMDLCNTDMYIFH